MSNISVSFNGSKEVGHKSMLFSGGEVHVNVDNGIDPKFVNDIYVKALIDDSNGLIETMLLCDALNNMYPDADKRCFIPYLPYSRQDRICTKGDANSLFVIANSILLSISKSGFELSTLDIHNPLELDTFPMSMKNHTQLDVLQCWPALLSVADKCILVAPDAGSVSKVNDIAKFLEHDKIIIGEKIRNPETGALSGFDAKLYRGGEPDTDNNLHGRDVFIFDDICDGGGTFLGLIDILKARKCGKVYLYVSHGIFSKGLKIFENRIDKIFTTTSITSIGSREIVDSVPVARFPI